MSAIFFFGVPPHFQPRLGFSCPCPGLVFPSGGFCIICVVKNILGIYLTPSLLLYPVLNGLIILRGKHKKGNYYYYPWHTKKAAMGHVQPTPAPPIMHLISRIHISNFLLITFIPLLTHILLLLLLLTTIIPPIIPMLPLLLYPPTYIHSLPKARHITPNDCRMVPTTVTMAEDR